MKTQKQKTAKKQNTFQKIFFKIINWIKNWSPYAKNKTINCLIYILGLFIILGVNYCVMFGSFVPKFFIVDILIMIVSVSPIFFFKGTMFDRIWIPALLVIVTVFITVNVNYFKFFNVVFSLKDWKMAFDNIGQAGAHAAELYWSMIIANIIMCLIFVAGVLVFNIKFRFNETKSTKMPTRRKINIFASVFMASSIILYEFSMGMWTISEKNKGVDSIKYVDYSPTYHFKNLGMASYYNRAFRAETFDKGASDEDVVNYLSNPTAVSDDYTGDLSADKPNVFVILIETGDELMLNPYTTPNLWKLFKEEGIYCDHNFSYNHSNVTNTISMTGNYPMKALNQNKNYTAPFCLPQILKKLGYNTRYYFDCVESEDGYGEMKFFKMFGFDNRFYHDDLLPGVKPWTYMNADFIEDSRVAEKVVENMKKFTESSPDEKFYAQWYTTVMHMNNNVTDSNKELSDRLHAKYDADFEKAKEAGWTNPFTTEETRKRFEFWTLKTMDFDNALGQIMNFLYGPDAPASRRNTIIAAYGDHAWYEEVDGKIMAKWGKHVDDTDNINAYKTVLGFYHPSLTLKSKIEQDKTGLFDGHNLQCMTTPACIVPTILDLMGIPYNPKIYQDKSIFNLNGLKTLDKNYDDIYYSVWLSMYMNEYYTSDNGCSITNVVNDIGKKDEFIQKVREKEKQLRIIDSIYHKNFFDRYDYDKFLPSSTISNNYCTEYALVKQY